MRSRHDAGQASTEYAGVLALLAVVLIAAATAVAAPDLPGAIVRHVRVALCIVGGDVCRTADARAKGLEPCVQSAEGASRDVGVGIAVVTVGHSKEYVIEERSDGSVVVRGFDGGSLGREFSLGGSIGPVRVEAGPSITAGLSFRRGREWHFRTMAEAQQLLEAVHDPLRTLTDDGNVHYYGAPRAPYRYREGGGSLGASLDLELGSARNGVSIDGLTTERRAALGRRVGPDGTTLYYHLDGATSGLLGDLVPGLKVDGPWVAEWHLGTPQAVTLRSVEAEDGAKRREAVVRLDLTEPGDREAALKLVLLEPLPGIGPAAARDFLARVRARGSVERFTHDQVTEEGGAALEARVNGGDIGGHYRQRSSSRTLVGAELLDGDRVVQRIDCLGLDRS